MTAGQMCLVGSVVKEETSEPATSRPDTVEGSDMSPPGWRWLVEVVDGERHEFQTGDVVRCAVNNVLALDGEVSGV